MTRPERYDDLAAAVHRSGGRYLPHDTMEIGEVLTEGWDVGPDGPDESGRIVLSLPQPTEEDFGADGLP